MGNRHGTTYQTEIVITTTFKILKPSKMVVLLQHYKNVNDLSKLFKQSLNT